MRYLEFVSDNGRSAVFSDRPPYFMTTPPRFSVGSSGQVIKPPGMDGQDTYSVTLDAGNAFLAGMIVAYGDGFEPAQRRLDALKEQLCFLFHPKFWGTLTYHSELGVRRIRCRAPATPTFGEYFNNSMTFAVDLVADDPTWRGETQEASAGGNYLNHRFPWYLPADGSPFSVSVRDIIVYNASPVDIAPVVEVYNTYGQMVEISNDTTGAMLSVSRVIADGQKLVIDTQEVTVWLWREADGQWTREENALNWLDADSNIPSFRIVPGANQLTVNRAMVGQRPIMKIIWAEPVVGV